MVYYDLIYNTFQILPLESWQHSVSLYYPSETALDRLVNLEEKSTKQLEYNLIQKDYINSVAQKYKAHDLTKQVNKNLKHDTIKDRQMWGTDEQ